MKIKEKEKQMSIPGSIKIELWDKKKGALPIVFYRVFQNTQSKNTSSIKTQALT